MTADITRIPVPSLPKGQVRRKIPKPFARPSITIGAGIPPADRREWAEVPAGDIRVGDIIPGIGRVFAVNNVLEVPRAGSGLAPEEIAGRVKWTATISGGADNTRTYHGSDIVWAFTSHKGASDDRE